MKTLLYRLNPVCKIWILIFLIIPVTFSQDMLFPFLVLVFIMLGAYAFSGIGIIYFYHHMKVIILSSMCLFIFLVLNKTTSDTGDFYLLGLYFHFYAISQATSLALRMIGFAYAAFIFAKTTDPVVLALSLVKEWHMPVQAAYSFLVAYRYIPLFQKEFQKIRIAHEMRRKMKIPFINYFYFPTYLLPMMIQAIRIGDKVSIAMEARGFLSSKNRTFYKTILFTKIDRFVLIMTVVILLLLMLTVIFAGQFKFGLGF